VKARVFIYPLKTSTPTQGTGAELWFIGTIETAAPVDVFNENAEVNTLLISANGKIKVLGVCIDVDLEDIEIVSNDAQVAAVFQTNEKFAPVSIILQVNGTSLATAAPDLMEMNYNRVGILVGDYMGIKERKK
jgi:hypothetical protein